MLTGCVSIVLDEPQLLNVGIPLPSLPGLTFNNSVLTLEQDYVLIGIDFQVGDL